MATNGDAMKAWNEFISAPESEELLAPYRKAAQEPASLFNALGEDLGSSSRDKRARAFWVLVHAMPEFGTILHERQSRDPRWRTDEHIDQYLFNRGADVVSHLHHKLVNQGVFDASKGKDPRPYLHKALNNWKQDALREEKREITTDATLLESGPMSLAAHGMVNSSAETEAIDALAFEQTCREILSWGWVSPNEMSMFQTILGDEGGLITAAEALDIPATSDSSRERARVRKRFQRARDKATRQRDAAVLGLIYHIPRMHIASWESYKAEVIDEYRPQNVIKAIGWESWLGDSICTPSYNPPLISLRSLGFSVTPLTTAYGGKPGHLYLILLRDRALASKYRPIDDGILNIWPFHFQWILTVEVLMSWMNMTGIKHVVRSWRDLGSDDEELARYRRARNDDGESDWDFIRYLPFQPYLVSDLVSDGSILRRHNEHWKTVVDLSEQERDRGEWVLDSNGRFMRTNIDSSFE